MAWVCSYTRCDGTGFLYDDATNTATDCPCRPQLIAYTRSSRLRARIPRKFANVDFNQPPVTDMPQNVVRVVRRYVDNLDDRLEIGRGLWFEGPQGTGKTTLAMLVSKHALAAGKSVAVYSVPRILSEMRDTFDDDSEMGSTELIDRLTEVELLQLDDLGAERTSPWVLEQLYAVINARYEAERAVLVTTNLGREELIDQVGARTVSRLTEMCDVLPLYGEDRRLTSGLPAMGKSPAQPGRVRPQGDPTEGLSGAYGAARAHAITPEAIAAPPSQYPAEPPSWWDRRDPWPPPAEPGLQGSTRRGGSAT